MVSRKEETVFECDGKTKPRFLMSSNQPLIGEDFSYEDRQHIVSVGDFYHFRKRELGKSPDQIHGSWLFDEHWVDDNWQEFDAFCVKALNFYLRNGLVDGGSSDSYRHIVRLKGRLLKQLVLHNGESTSSRSPQLASHLGPWLLEQSLMVNQLSTCHRNHQIF